MSIRPPEYLKKKAEAYARLIMSGETDSTKIKSLRKDLGFSDSIDSASGALLKKNCKETVPDGIQRVGIWKSEWINGEKYFVKDKDCAKNFWFWSDIPVIPPKGKNTRVAFLGESVARGYLFSPYFTPVKCLQAILDENTEKQEYEVIDLACISINMEDLTELCKASILLEPDIIVVFAGNNWKHALYPLTDEEAQEMIDISETSERFEKMKIILEKKYYSMIDNLLKSIHDTYSQYNIPAIFVIPEFNLKDWEVPTDDTILFWPGGKTGKWLELKDKLTHCLELNDLVNAERISTKLIEINPANPLGYKIMAECKLRQGLTEETRKYLEAVRDTSIYRRIFPPACISFIRETISNIAPQYGIGVVDLPEMFKEYLQGGIPGNDLFIDYCHMNEKGIQIAMKYLAKYLLHLEKGRNRTNENIRSPHWQPDPKVVADAHFLAAIHCAHNGEQPYDTLYYHCLQAIQASEHVMDHMVNYIDMVSRKVPLIYNKNCKYFSKFGLVAQYPMLFQPNDCRLMDVNLTNAMVDALRVAGKDIKSDVDTLRIRYFKPCKEKVNLLESYYREKSYIYSGTDSGYFAFGEKAYYSAINCRSTFYLIADRQDNIRIEFTFRSSLPERKKEDILMKVNGVMVGSKPAYDQWQDLSVIVTKELLKEDGVNLIDIDWPLIDCVEKDLCRKNASRYSGDELVLRSSRLVYGDIFRLNAQVCGD